MSKIFYNKKFHKLVDKSTLKEGDFVIVDSTSERQVAEVIRNEFTGHLAIDNSFGQETLILVEDDLYQATAQDWDFFHSRFF